MKGAWWMPRCYRPMKDGDRAETYTGSCDQAKSRVSPNGATHAGHTCVSDPESIGVWKGTGGTETSQYLEDKKSTEIPLVVASERGPAQTSVPQGAVGL
jgi:hypothetical protein